MFKCRPVTQHKRQPSETVKSYRRINLNKKLQKTKQERFIKGIALILEIVFCGVICLEYQAKFSN